MMPRVCLMLLTSCLSPELELGTVVSKRKSPSQFALQKGYEMTY